jgi:hypothetical protein
MRVINRILVLTDSTSPFGQAVFRTGVDRGYMALDLVAQFDEQIGSITQVRYLWPSCS